MSERHKLLVSFSGGRTSAFMAKRLKDFYGHTFEMVFVFANTGQEHEKTLIFADRCDREWGLSLVWVESVVHHGERASSTHKIVTFETASRHGEPFEEIIKKYGIPNKAFPHCTRELKRNPIRSYMDSIGWNDASTAVGIRIDEPKRIRKDADKDGIAYPLVNLFPSTKPQILDWWEEQPFDLGLLDYQGNCTWCWKKSLKKHVRLYQESPQIFDFPARMEERYGLTGAGQLEGVKRTFFREYRSTKDIVTLAQLLNPGKLEFQDEDTGCSESCEVFV